MLLIKESKSGKFHKETSKKLRKNSYYNNLEPMNVENIQLFPEVHKKIKIKNKLLLL